MIKLGLGDAAMKAVRRAAWASLLVSTCLLLEQDELKHEGAMNNIKSKKQSRRWEERG